MVTGSRVQENPFGTCCIKIILCQFRIHRRSEGLLVCSLVCGSGSVAGSTDPKSESKALHRSMWNYWAFASRRQTAVKGVETNGNEWHVFLFGRESQAKRRAFFHLLEQGSKQRHPLVLLKKRSKAKLKAWMICKQMCSFRIYRIL